MLARDRLPVALELEADRLASLRLPADEFSREIEVIKEERRLRTDDQPNSKAFELFRAMAYPASGYHTPTIGWMADLERMKVEELRHWYESWYAPNNATLVVVGDVTVDEVKGLAQKYFAGIPKRAVPPAKLPLELAEPGQRQLTLHVRTQLPSLIYGFNVPRPGDHPGAEHGARPAPDLSLARRRLQCRHAGPPGARSGAGGRGIVRLNAFTRGDSLFLISATPNVQKQKTLADVEKGIWQLLEELKTTPLSAEELERISAQVIAGLVYDRDSISSQATTIGQLETVGLSWKLIDSELDELKRVTPQDIQNAARTYFTRERLSAAHPLPQESAHE